jgi:hypothetical protein
MSTLKETGIAFFHSHVFEIKTRNCSDIKPNNKVHIIQYILGSVSSTSEVITSFKCNVTADRVLGTANTRPVSTMQRAARWPYEIACIMVLCGTAL